MANIQVPPGVGTSGQLLDAFNSASTIQRQVVVIGDPGSTAGVGPVTSSAGQLVSVSSGTFTLSSAPTVNVSSGTFTLSSNPTVISASSGLVQTLTTGPIVVSSAGLSPTILPTISTAGFAPVTSSYGLAVNLLSTANVVQVTNTPTVVSASSGLVQVLTTGTYLIVSASSGLIQTLTTGAMVLSSAGITQVMPVTSSGINLYTTQGVNVAVTGSSGLAAPVTSSGGLSIHITDVTGPVTSSWGVVVQESTGAGGGVTSTFFLLTTVQAIKTIAGKLMGFCCYATAPGIGVVGFYNFTTGNVTVGTSATLIVPIASMSTAAGSFPPPITWLGPNGLNFATAISVATAGSATSGTVVSTATPVNMSAFYL